MFFQLISTIKVSVTNWGGGGGGAGGIPPQKNQKLKSSEMVINASKTANSDKNF